MQWQDEFYHNTTLVLRFTGFCSAQHFQYLNMKSVFSQSFITFCGSLWSEWQWGHFDNTSVAQTSTKIYLDFWKAFGMVPITSLSLWRDVWDGFEGWTAHWIRNWLEGRSQSTVVNGCLGNGLHQVEADHKWCPQASALGPELFNAYQWHGWWDRAHPH